MTFTAFVLSERDGSLLTNCFNRLPMNTRQAVEWTDLNSNSIWLLIWGQVTDVIAGYTCVKAYRSSAFHNSPRLLTSFLTSFSQQHIHLLL